MIYFYIGLAAYFVIILVHAYHIMYMEELRKRKELEAAEHFRIINTRLDFMLVKREIAFTDFMFQQRRHDKKFMDHSAQRSASEIGLQMLKNGLIKIEIKHPQQPVQDPYQAEPPLIKMICSALVARNTENFY